MSRRRTGTTASGVILTSTSSKSCTLAECSLSSSRAEQNTSTHTHTLLTTHTLEKTQTHNFEHRDGREHRTRTDTARTFARHQCEILATYSTLYVVARHQCLVSTILNLCKHKHQKKDAFGSFYGSSLPVMSRLVLVLLPHLPTSRVFSRLPSRKAFYDRLTQFLLTLAPTSPRQFCNFPIFQLFQF